MRHGAEAAAHKYLKAALGLTVDFFNLGKVADVMHHHQTTGFGFATGEGWLELAAEVLDIVMAEQELGKGVSVRRCVEGLSLADTGQVAAGDVADGVAAGFASRYADGGQTPHQVRRVLDVHEV